MNEFFIQMPKSKKIQTKFLGKILENNNINSVTNDGRSKSTINSPHQKYYEQDSYHLKTYIKYFQRKLYIKYNTLPHELNIIELNNFINAKYFRALAIFKEKLLQNCYEEFLKKFYREEESYKKIPLFFEYYKVYLIFFCTPTYADFHLNEFVGNIVKQKAKIYYDINYREKINERKTKYITLFNSKVRKELSRESNISDLSKTTIENKTNTKKSNSSSFHVINKILIELESKQKEKITLHCKHINNVHNGNTVSYKNKNKITINEEKYDKMCKNKVKFRRLKADTKITNSSFGIKQRNYQKTKLTSSSPKVNNKNSKGKDRNLNSKNLTSIIKKLINSNNNSNNTRITENKKIRKISPCSRNYTNFLSNLKTFVHVYTKTNDFPIKKVNGCRFTETFNSSKSPMFKSDSKYKVKKIIKSTIIKRKKNREPINENRTIVSINNNNFDYKIAELINNPGLLKSLKIKKTSSPTQDFIVGYKTIENNNKFYKNNINKIKRLKILDFSKNKNEQREYRVGNVKFTKKRIDIETASKDKKVSKSKRRKE